jgi:crotonobetainyl-CoA:carnitine CoA-transferase CaiB-like acyl-CoA transferase
MTKALRDIRILDLSKLLPGNYCGMILADYGAEVIKIEAPDSPDPARAFQPRKHGLSYWHITFNRGKKSLCLDFKKEEGRAVLRSLVRQADVLIESFRPGVMESLDLSFAALAAVNPRLIYCCLSGYGQAGKEAALPAHDLNIAGLCGLAKRAGGKPYTGLPLSGMSAALQAAVAVLAALHARALTGRGQRIDIALTRSALALLPVEFANYFAAAETGYSYPERTAGYGVYKTLDEQYFAVATLEEKFWRRLCELLAMPDLADIPAFDRDAQEDAIARLAAVFAQKTRAEWEEFFAGENICVTPVYTFAEAIESGRLQDSGMLLSLEDSLLGSYQQLDCPARLSDTPPAAGGRAPLLGEDNRTVLREFSFAETEIDRLEKDGVLKRP